VADAAHLVNIHTIEMEAVVFVASLLHCCEDLQQRGQVFSGMLAGILTARFLVQRPHGACHGEVVTANYFSVGHSRSLGATHGAPMAHMAASSRCSLRFLQRPVRGRSDDCWRTIYLNGYPFTVDWCFTAGFFGLEVGTRGRFDSHDA